MSNLVVDLVIKLDPKNAHSVPIQKGWRMQEYIPVVTNDDVDDDDDDVDIDDDGVDDGVDDDVEDDVNDGVGGVVYTER